MYLNHITEAIGNTPMVKLNKVTTDIKGTVLVKVEYFNPGNSVKDRMAMKMVQDAELRGDLKLGYTIIEATSGNTGMGLALVATLKGYKCIFVTNDKQSPEKINTLKAMGAKVVICASDVSPDSPDSMYKTAERIHNETPNSYYPNQYYNSSNAEAHYLSTGPEIWNQSDKKVTHWVAGAGTGGTISGVSRFLKEQNPSIYTIGIDTYGSVFKKYKDTGIYDEAEIYNYYIEGIGEDIIPSNVHFDLINEFIKVDDKSAALMARRLAAEEGLLVGYSSGAAVAGGLEWAKNNALNENDVMVILLPDHGSRCLNKIYNDEWMKSKNFL